MPASSHLLHMPAPCARPPDPFSCCCLTTPLLPVVPWSATLQEQAFPRVQRDITQVEAYSSKLRARAARGDAGAETLEASRLLAGEGLNPRKLTQASSAWKSRTATKWGHVGGARMRRKGGRWLLPLLLPAAADDPTAVDRVSCPCWWLQALQTFELRPTYEDVFAVETATVDEYLQQVGSGCGRRMRQAPQLEEPELWWCMCCTPSGHPYHPADGTAPAQWPSCRPSCVSVASLLPPSLLRHARCAPLHPPRCMR